MPDTFTEKIVLFTKGEAVKHPNGDFEVDEAFASAFMESFASFYGSRDYRPPILRNHEDDTGLTSGRVLSVEEDEDHIYGLLEWAAGYKELRESGQIQNFSPSFYPAFEDPHSNEVYPFLLREVSYVAVPHLKNLPSPTLHAYSLHDLIEQRAISLLDSSVPLISYETGPQKVTLTPETHPEEAIMAKEEEDKRFQALEARISALEETLDATAANEDEGDDDSKEEGVENVENSEEAEGEEAVDALISRNAALQKTVDELRESIAAYEQEALRSELSEAIDSLDDELFEHLVALKEQDATLYDVTVSKLSEAGSQNLNASKAKGKTGFPTAPTDTTISLEEAKKEAESRGLRGAAKIDWMQEIGVIK